MIALLCFIPGLLIHVCLFFKENLYKLPYKVCLTCNLVPYLNFFWTSFSIVYTYGIFILGEALLTEELLESVISALKHLKASDDLKNIEIANLYIEILNFYPKDSLSRFIKSLLADNLADLNHHATNAVAKAIALTTILCFFEKHSELVGPSFGALSRLPLEATFVAPKNNRIIQKLVGDVAWQFCSHQVGTRN